MRALNCSCFDWIRSSVCDCYNATTRVRFQQCLICPSQLIEGDSFYHWLKDDCQGRKKECARKRRIENNGSAAVLDANFSIVPDHALHTVPIIIARRSCVATMCCEIQMLWNIALQKEFRVAIMLFKYKLPCNNVLQTTLAWLSYFAKTTRSILWRRDICKFPMGMAVRVVYKSKGSKGFLAQNCHFSLLKIWFTYDAFLVRIYFPVVYIPSSSKACALCETALHIFRNPAQPFFGTQIREISEGLIRESHPRFQLRRKSRTFD